MALDARSHPRYATEACWWYLEGCGLRKRLTLRVTVVEGRFFVLVFRWSVIVNFPRLNMLCFVVLLLHIPGGSMLNIRLPVQETQETRVWSLGREDPLEEEMAPPQVFLSGECHGQRSLAGYSPCGCKESDTTEWLSLTHHLKEFPVNQPKTSNFLRHIFWLPFNVRMNTGSKSRLAPSLI